MLTAVLKSNTDPKTFRDTHEHISRELKSVNDAELVVSNSWIDALNTKNTYICFLESDCRVNSGYFSSQIGLFKKNPMYRKLAMLSSAAAVSNWANKVYGYRLGDKYSDGILPVRDKVSTSVYPVQIGFVPGAIIRVNMLKKALKDLDATNGMENDLVRFSIDLSLTFWRQGDGNTVHLNPNTTYVTNQQIDQVGQFDPKATDLVSMFKRQLI